MVVGILQFELLIHGGESLKDKRRVVASVKDRLHRDFQVSVAEIGSQEILNQAILGLAAVGNDGAHIGRVLDTITARLRVLGDAELGSTTRRILVGHASEVGLGVESDESDDALAAEMLARADDTDQESTR
jgi:uncharacterized protein YlxP (DUF503 family)